jgi:anti-sigma factor RsiW
MKPFITCKELVDFLGDYAEGELPAPTLAEFHRHLAVCPSCINYVESYKATRLLGKAALCDPKDPGQPAPADVPEDLIRAILAARKKPAN